MEQELNEALFALKQLVDSIYFNQQKVVEELGEAVKKLEEILKENGFREEIGA